jgi:hypothetical protein
MTLSARSPLVLTTAIAVLIGCAFAGTAAQARAAEETEGRPRSEAPPRGAAAASERARQRKAEQAAKGAKAGAEQPVQYPQATRVPPGQKATPKEGKTANEIQAAYDAKKYADVFAKVDAFAASGSTNAYLLSYLYQVAAIAANDSGDQSKAADYFKKTVDANGLDNNGHYQSMYNLAILQSQLDRNQEALATLDKFMAETKSDKVEPLALKAYVLGNLDRAAEGAALFEQVLARNPNDRPTMMNAVALYQQAGNFDKANTLLESARKKGLLTEGSEYRTLFVGYINANKYTQAQEVLEEGVNKGAIKPSQQLASDYSILAQNFYADGKIAQTVDFYTRANKVATNGEAALNLAKVLRNEDRMGEAKAAAREALAKGVKKPKDANDILAMPGGK